MQVMQIGDYFEKLVEGLKEVFQGGFDAISLTVGWAVSGLKNTLLLSPEHLYASVAMGAVLTLVTALWARRFSPRLLVPALLVAVVVFAALETWRLGELNREITPEQATVLAEEFSSLHEALAGETPVRPEETVLLAAAREKVMVLGGEVAQEAALAALATSRRWKRFRASDAERVLKNLEEVQAALSVREIAKEIPEEMAKEIRRVVTRWRALAAMEPIGHLARDLGTLETPQVRARFLSQRNFQKLDEALAAVRAYAEELAQPELAAATRQVAEELQRFSPSRFFWYGPVVVIAALVLLAHSVAGKSVALFALAGLWLVERMHLWEPAMESLALVLAATGFALLLGIPMGIVAARSATADRLLRPLLDLMQTMPAFVYLIPAVIFFGLGEVPGAMATLIFSMPPAVRLTTLGIRQVPEEIVEAAQAFGATGRQMLFKAQLPIALPTILAGVNQTIMLSLSMVVIAGMIGAGGLGSVVLSGITQMKLGLGFEGGLAVVILAIYLDRVTQALGARK